MTIKVLLMAEERGKLSNAWNWQSLQNKKEIEKEGNKGTLEQMTF